MKHVFLEFKDESDKYPCCMLQQIEDKYELTDIQQNYEPIPALDFKYWSLSA